MLRPFKCSVFHFMKKIDLSGQRVGSWTILAESVYMNGKGFWKCRCICKKEKLVSVGNLRAGTSTSCGCVAKYNFVRNHTIHGHTIGKKRSPEFNSWSSMIQRCTDKKHKYYKHYGGRGIKVCERWLNSFENFLMDMGQKPSKLHTLDKFPNNDGNYEPSNCRWATKKEQNRNQRTNRWIEYKGTNLILSDWADILHISPARLLYYIKKGKDFSDIVAKFKC